MTPARYLVARIGLAFGYVRKTYRLSEATLEMHLLREAEAYLGMRVWEDVEQVDALSSEYWNLRKLIKERDQLKKKITESRERLDKAHEERAAMINGAPEVSEELEMQRKECMGKLEKLARERDEVVEEAKRIRRTYTGLKTKREVMKEESRDKPTSEDERKEMEVLDSRLDEIRQQFDGLKERRAEIGQSILELERMLDEVDKKVATLRQDRRTRAAEAFQVIGDMNKELSQLRAEEGVIEVRTRQFYSDIGRYVSLYAGSDPKCAVVARKEQGLVGIMKALRKSVELNHKLAGVSF